MGALVSVFFLFNMVRLINIQPFTVCMKITKVKVKSEAGNTDTG